MSDPVHSPKHYTIGKIEVIDFIEDQNLGFHLGNALKYICRAGIKDTNTEAQDLEKAIWHLKRQIELIKADHQMTLQGLYRPDQVMCVEAAIKKLGCPKGEGDGKLCSDPKCFACRVSDPGGDHSWHSNPEGDQS